MKKISVITVTYNSERTIKDCLDSVLKYSEAAEIIVVDNGSKDETLTLVKQYGKKVILVEAGENLGFSKANNLGAKSATGDYFVFLNPDAMLTKRGDLEHLQEILEKSPQYAILGPKLVYPDNTSQPKVRNLPTVFRAVEEYILGIKSKYSFYEPKCSGLCEVESVNGACLMIKREVFERAGGFDEKFFMYYEELELCRKVRDLGYKVGFTSEITVIHAEGVSAAQNKRVNQVMRESARKYFGFPTYCLLEVIFLYNRLANKFRKLAGQSAHV